MADDLPDNTIDNTQVQVSHKHAPADFDAQRQEMSTLGMFDWLGNKVLPKLLQVGAILAVVVAGLSGGGLGVLIAGTCMLGFEMMRAHTCNKADLNRELVLYRKEIAQAVGKKPTDVLTIQDMYHAADEKAVGDKAIKPLKVELDHLRYRSRYNYIMGGVRALITTGTALLFSSAFAQFSSNISQAPTLLAAGKSVLSTLGAMGPTAWFAITGAVGAASLLTASAENYGKQYFETYKPPSVFHELDQLQQASKRQDVGSMQVFDIIVKLDKNMAKDIEAHMGKPYDELTARNKNRVIKACEGKTHAAALAEAINNGQLPVTAIALSAMGQMTWPQVQHAQSPVQPAMVQDQQVAKSHVKDLVASRLAKAELPAIHTPFA